MTTKFFRFPWATSGDKTAIADATDPSGTVTYQSGYGADYARDPSTDPLAKLIERDKMNQALYDVTSNLQDWQVHSFPEYITAADNGGVAYAYDIYTIVRYDNGSGSKLYQNITAANTNVPTGAGWVEYGVAGITHASTSKTTPVDADEIPLVDSAASNVLKKLTWANLKTTINTYIATIYAPLASPALTGNPTAPTAADGTNTTKLATTAFVKNNIPVFVHWSTAKATPSDTDEFGIADSAASYGLKKLSWANLKATLLSSPALTGTPTAPTQLSSDNSTKIATTAWSKVGFSISIGTNGYVKFPTWLGGLVIQWGTYAGSEDAWALHNFPIAFPHDCFAVVAGEGKTGYDNGGNDYNNLVRPVSTTQFAQVNNERGSANFTIIAVGY